MQPHRRRPIETIKTFDPYVYYIIILCISRNVCIGACAIPRDNLFVNPVGPRIWSIIYSYGTAVVRVRAHS